MFRSEEMEIFCTNAVIEDWTNCNVHQTDIIITDELLAANAFIEMFCLCWLLLE